MSNNTYKVDYASSARSSCKHTKCKKPIEKLHLRIGKLYPSDRFETDGQAIDWFHPDCFFEKQKKARKTTKKVDDIDDLQGFDDIKKSDQKYIQELIQDHKDSILKPKSKSKAKSKDTSKAKPKASSSWFVDDSGNVTNSDDEDNVHHHHQQQQSKSTSNNNNNSNKKQQKQTFKPSEDDLFDEEDLMDSYDTSKSLQSNIQSSTSKNSTSTTKKQFKLSSILSKKWYSSLEPVLTKNKALFDEIVGEKRNVNHNLPISTQIFSSLNYVGSPKDCKVIFFGASPNYKKETSCGFSFCDASADKWTLNNINSSTKNLIRAALINRGYITKEDTLDSIQEALKEVDLPSDSPRDWFKSTAKQGVLWLNSSLTTSTENEDNKVPAKIEAYWKPVVAEIIRTIFQSKIEEEDPSPTIVVLLGKQLSQLRSEVELIHSEFMGAVPVEFIEGTSPFLELFLNENYLKKINTYLESYKSAPIDWWKPKDDDEEEEEEGEEEEEEVEFDKNVQKESEKSNLSGVNSSSSSSKSNNKFNHDDIFDQEEGPKDIDMDDGGSSRVKSKSNSQPSNDFIDNEGSDEVRPTCNLIQENGDKIQLKFDEPFTLGRNILEIKDKLVSRNQAIAKFIKSFSGTYCVELTPKGQNPVHIDKNGTLEPLDVGVPIYLNDGQEFLLCSQKYPFTVEILSKPTTPKKPAVKQSQQSQQINKRKYDDFEEEGSVHSSIGSSSKSTPSKKAAKTSPEKLKAKPKPKAKPKKKDDDFIDEDYDDFEADDSDDDYIPPSDDDENEFVGVKPFVKTRSQDLPDCKYWDRCYRQNKQHHLEFRHPFPFKG